jgi:hypothetical protein
MNKATSYYRFPNLTLSRDKMATVTNKYGVKNSRNKDNADIWVISSKYIESLCKRQWNINLLKLDDIRDAHKKYKKSFSKAYLQQFENMVQGLDGNYMVEYLVHHLRYNAKSLYEYLSSRYVNQSTNSFISEEDDIILQNILNNTTKVVSDITMNNIASEDSVALDFDSYTQIKNMLSNYADREVAMSIMSNCRIEDSKTWLGFIFFDETDNLRGGTTWNQVAFKTLKKRFESYIYNHSTYIGSSEVNKLTRLLCKDDAMTEEASVILGDRMHISVNKHLRPNSSFSIDREAIKFNFNK